MDKDLQINIRVSADWLEARRKKRDALKPGLDMSKYFRDMIEDGEEYYERRFSNDCTNL